MSETRLHFVDDADGQRATFGDLQAAWLREQGLIELVRFEATGPQSGVNFYRPTAGHSALQLNDLVVEQPSLRECDFCRVTPCGWRTHVRPFQLTAFPYRGRFQRDIFTCGECAELVRANRKTELIDRTIEATVRNARERGGAIAAHVATLTSHQIRAGIGPMIRDFVKSVFANRQGVPEREEESEAA